MKDRLRLFAARWMMRATFALKWRGKRASGLSITNETITVKNGRIAVRIYTPPGAGPFPVILFFHGGGWVAGGLDTHDGLCRALSARSGHLLVAVDYRLAPEHPFPIPVEDCLAALAWLKGNASRLSGIAGRIVLCGDSAGGNLAAVCAQQARSLHPGLVQGQILVYPVLDHCGFAQWPSYQTHGDSSFELPHTIMTQLWGFYLGRSPLWPAGATAHELATPLHTADLKGLPPALILIAEEDMLRDEAAEYGRRLSAAGCMVEVRHYADQQHGFVSLEPTAAQRQAVADMAGWLAG